MLRDEYETVRMVLQYKLEGSKKKSRENPENKCVSVIKINLKSTSLYFDDVINPIM